ncbi:hypothetical protein LCGC14_1649180 [marine sediment metagenome]|uniref:Uncharacterized protein n=1 Tax=marine sediment metagenome TaxID=412755 RepID=A0A0F9IJW2_9ZZZZ
MSLLTDKEQARFIEFPVEGYTSDRDGLCRAQQAKTLKAVAEWGNELCAEHQGESQLRKQCIFCVEGLFLCASDGKMPGETD